MSDAPHPSEPPGGSPHPRPAVDEPALLRVSHRLERPPVPWLHDEAARRMASRLAVLREPPATVLDWPARPAGVLPELTQALPEAQILRVLSGRALQLPQRRDEAAKAEAMQSRSDRRAWVWPWTRRAAASAHSRPQGSAAPAALSHALLADAIPDASARMIWSVMALHWQRDPLALMRRWHAALSTGGVLMFTTFGPGTLRSLQDAWTERGLGPAMAPLVDMHDLGDMLAAAGFADPVMDQEIIKLQWSSASAALAELRTMGANAHRERFAGLRGRGWRDAAAGALPQGPTHRGGPGVTLEFEIVYGHAFKPAPRAAVSAETRLTPQALQEMARSSRQRPSGA